MRGAVLIALKDLGSSVRDRSAIAVSLVAPLLLAFILSTVLGGSGEQSFDITFGVVDQDDGPVAAAFIEGPLGGLTENNFAELEEFDSPEEARRAAEGDEIAAAIVVPEGFSTSIQSGGRGTIEITASPESEIGAPIARAVAQGFVAELNAISLGITTTASGGAAPPTDEQIARLRERIQAIETPVRLEESSAGNKEFVDGKTFFAAGMAVFFLFFTTQFGAVSILRERREGTLARLLASPMSKSSIVAGKALFTFVLGVVSMSVLAIATTFLLGAEWGDPLGVGLLIVAGVGAAMGIQSLVTTLAKTDEQAAGYGSIIAVTLGLLGGTFFPLSQAPGFVSNLSYVTPHAWLMRGFGDLSGGSATIADLFPPLIALLIFATLTGGLALFRARAMVVAP